MKLQKGVGEIQIRGYSNFGFIEVNRLTDNH